MINIEIYKEKNGYHITSLGHSGYAPQGEDIVCAAVSAIMLHMSMISAEFHEGKLEEMKEGYIRVYLPRNDTTELIIEALKSTLRTLGIRYGKYVSWCTVQGGDEKRKRSL